MDDYLDLGSEPRSYFRVSLQHESADRPACYARLIPSPVDWSSGMFPDASHGFLYYCVPPNSPPLAGELRFRITHSRDPASFAAGYDLRTEQGMPWRCPLYRVVSRQDLRDVVALLLQDGLVSQRTLDLAAAAIATLRASVSRRDPSSSGGVDRFHLSPTPLSAFGQEFLYRYGNSAKTWCLFIGSDTILRLRIQRFSSFRTPVLPVGRKFPYKHYYPFEGSAIASFERSTLPEHDGRRVAVMRIKRFLDSDPIREVPAPNGCVYPVDALRPREGELALTMIRGKVCPWAVNVDHKFKSRKAFKILFDNEEMYGSPRGM